MAFFRCRGHSHQYKYALSDQQCSYELHVFHKNSAESKWFWKLDEDDQPRNRVGLRRAALPSLNLMLGTSNNYLRAAAIVHIHYLVSPWFSFCVTGVSEENMRALEGAFELCILSWIWTKDNRVSIDIRILIEPSCIPEPFLTFLDSSFALRSLASELIFVLNDRFP